MSRRRKSTPTRTPPADLPFAGAALLVALLALPAFFNIQSSTSFEPDKGALLRTLALAALLPLAAGWRPDWRAINLSLKLLIGVLAITTFATLAGVDPVTSFWGNHERGYGLLSLLAGAILLLAARQAAQSGWMWAIIDAILLAAAIPALYGLLQLTGYDPVRGATVSFVLGQRASSSLGNPLFLADFLLTALILAAARLFAGPALRSGWRGGLWLYLLFLLAAFSATLSRSALIGAIAAAVFFFLAWGRQQQRRRLQILGLLVLAAGGMLLLLAWATPQLLPARLGDLFASGGTGGQRLLIWQAVFDLLAAHPRYLLAGLGPDALPLQIAQHLPATLAHFEVDWVFRLPDRAHTLPLELLTGAGVFGLLLWTGFWAALLDHLLPRLSRRLPHAAALLALTGAFLLAGVAALLAGWPAAPLGFAAGLLGGALLALLLAPAPSPAAAGPAAAPLAPYFLAVLAGHWLLQAFSFPTHAPALLIWAVMGMILAAPAPDPPARSAGPPEVSLWHLAGIALGSFAFSLSASSFEALLLWLLALILLLALANLLLRSRSLAAQTWIWFLLPTLLLLPAIWLNRSPGLPTWLAYTWFLAWLLLQALLLIPAAERRHLRPGLLALILLILALNLPIYADIAYKSAILSPHDPAARQTLMRRAFLLGPHDHVLAAGIAPTENQALPPGASLDHAQAQRIIQLYEQAMAAQPLAPESPAAYAEWLRGSASLDPAAADQAAALFARTLALSPHDIQTRNRQALLLADLGALAAAEAALVDLLPLDPLYGPTYLNLAEVHRRQDDLEAARAVLRQGVVNVPWWDALPRALEQLP